MAYFIMQGKVLVQTTIDDIISSLHYSDDCDFRNPDFSVIFQNKNNLITLIDHQYLHGASLTCMIQAQKTAVLDLFSNKVFLKKFFGLSDFYKKIQTVEIILQRTLEEEFRKTEKSFFENNADTIN